MAAYRRVYDSRHLQADCQEPGSAPDPYARQSSMGYLFTPLRRGHDNHQTRGPSFSGPAFSVTADQSVVEDTPTRLCAMRRFAG